MRHDHTGTHIESKWQPKQMLVQNPEGERDRESGYDCEHEIGRDENANTHMVYSNNIYVKIKMIWKLFT